MSRIRSKAVLATIAALALAPTLAAHATDVTLVNNSTNNIHPFVRSNCFDERPWLISKPDAWTPYGTVMAGGSFTWPHFDDQMKPGCNKPEARMTFTLDGEPPPKGPGSEERTAGMEMDGLIPSYVITITGRPVLESVTPNNLYKPRN